jgi:3-oxoacyl-[acyl-carrier-protein] synthase II
MQRVVVTGMGSINPLGHTVADSWTNAIEGNSGVGPITLLDPSDLRIKIACEVKDFDPKQHLGAREARRRDRFEQFASVASKEAVAQAGFEVEMSEAGRVAVIISTAVGGLETLESGVIDMEEKGSRRVSPFMIPMFMPNGAAGIVAIDFGFKGPTFSVASACASGADGIGQAWHLIRSGIVDAAVAGASDMTITRIAISGFDRMGAMSSRGVDEPTPSPFDAERDGLVMGEGSAVLLLESLESAQARGAEILAEFVAYSATSDAYHVTAPSEEGVGGAAAMVNAMNLAEVNPDQIDYINAHGTGTQLNDGAETRAIKSALGEVAYDVPISSTKSMTGHMMGATGALEAIFCIQAIREGVIPPTTNLMNPDPECDLDYVPNEARQRKVAFAMSNAFGFGGHNAVLAFRAFSS